ncbi:hypothetical protein OAN96_01480 [Candidatus Gracilibacteria bacterium]|nr:hypothetical protein [Candidatus Gracilibacteria bacterium]
MGITIPSGCSPETRELARLYLQSEKGGEERLQTLLDMAAESAEKHNIPVEHFINSTIKSSCDLLDLTESETLELEVLGKGQIRCGCGCIIEAKKGCSKCRTSRLFNGN